MGSFYVRALWLIVFAPYQQQNIQKTASRNQNHQIGAGSMILSGDKTGSAGI